jgi:hypothetical protein
MPQHPQQREQLKEISVHVHFQILLDVPFVHVSLGSIPLLSTNVEYVHEVYCSNFEISYHWLIIYGWEVDGREVKTYYFI